MAQMVFYAKENQSWIEEISLLGQYIRALVLLSISSFVANSIFLSVTGAPYFVLMAGLAALGEFLPVVGPAASAVITLLVTGLSGYTHLLVSGEPGAGRAEPA